MIFLIFVQQYWWLFLLVVLCIFSILMLELMDAKDSSYGLDVQKAVQKVNQEHYMFVDIRDKSSFEKNHIPKAIHLSKSIKSSSKFVYYCEDDKKSRTLAKEKKQFYLIGGIERWMKSDMPIKEV